MVYVIPGRDFLVLSLKEYYTEKMKEELNKQLGTGFQGRVQKEFREGANFRKIQGDTRSF